MTSDAVSPSCKCYPVRISMTGKALSWCILSESRLLYRMVCGCSCMAILTGLNSDIMHRIMTHPALDIKSTISVGINMGKARIPIRNLIFCICSASRTLNYDNYYIQVLKEDLSFVLDMWNLRYNLSVAVEHSPYPSPGNHILNYNHILEVSICLP